MGGPSASILLRSAPTAADRSRVLAELAPIAAGIRNDNFWIGDEHPFLFTFRDDDLDEDYLDDDYPSELESIADSGLPTLLGWRPQGVLAFSALCNRPRDHELLAELCIHFAEHFGGVIAYDGRLGIGPDLGGPAPSAPLRIDAPEGLPGVLYAATYRAIQGYATCHYSDAAFLRAFVHHPRFHMVK